MLADDISMYLTTLAFFGVVPFYNRTTHQFRPKPYLTVPVMVITFVAIFWQINRFLKYGITRTTVLNEVSQRVIDVALSIQTKLYLNFTRKHRLDSLFDTFDLIDRKLQYRSKNCNRWLGFVLAIMVYLTFAVFDHMFWSPTHSRLDAVLYFVGNTVCCFCIQVHEVFIAMLIHELLKRFRMYNQLLREQRGNIDQYVGLHQKCVHLVHLINELYGCNFLLAYLQAFSYIWRWIHLFALHRHDDPATYFSWVWICNCIIQGVVVATMCERVSSEGMETVTISYHAMNRNTNVPVMRYKMFILAQQGASLFPTFSAAGFFKVDFSMLFAFINIITTYVIVIIQFTTTKTCFSGNSHTHTVNNTLQDLKLDLSTT